MNNTKYHQLENDQYAIVETGEIISKEELSDILKLEQLISFHESNEDLIQVGDIPSQTMRINSRNYNVVSIKNNYEFNKIFRVEVRSLMLDNNLSIHARATIATLEGFITFPDNCVIVNKKVPTIEDLMRIIGIGKSKLYDVLKELEKNKIISRVKENGTTSIYFNPFLYCSGKVVSKSTYDLFKESEFNK